MRPTTSAAASSAGDEPGAPDTWRFSIDVARAWERALDEAPTPASLRKVAMRSAMVMDPEPGGIFDTLLTLARRGLGGTAAGGRQYISWIHHHDFVRALRWLVEHEDVDGPVNLTAPGPLPNRDFMRELRRAWGMPIGLPASKLMLEAGARLMRTETELVLKSRRVVPGRLLDLGFEFDYPAWSAAALQLCEDSRRQS